MPSPSPDVPPSLLTERVAEGARETVRTLDARAVSRESARVDARLERLFALSPYVMETCLRRPEALERLLGDGSLRRDGATRDALVDELLADAAMAGDAAVRSAVDASGRRARGGRDATPEATCGATLDEEAQLAVLRAFRHRHLLRILWRDIEGLAALDGTLADLTRLAETCIEVAVRWAEAAERRRDGVPRDGEGREQRLIVLGMGKLGGGELNVSSDIDLICLWPAPGRTDGRRASDNGEHFVRVARRLTRLLGAVTADGFVYRVDTRLRPFGESGPLAMHLDAFEHYLLTQGRDWERYAMVKARAITGEAEDVAHLESLRRPFVYRRYLDYDALVSLAALKAKIRHSVAGGRARERDIKLGTGGIREVEFTGQAFQLVRGGRERRLQRRPIREVLVTLGELGLLEGGEARTLVAAYEYLRRVENALQAMRDEQTHALPRAGEDRARLVAMLGEPDEGTLIAVLDAHRRSVSRAFEGVLGGAGTGETGEAATGGDAKGADGGPPPDDPGAVSAWLDRHGVSPPPELAERVHEALAALSGGPFHRRLTARAQRRVETVLAPLVRAAALTADPPVALARGLDFVRAVAGRSGYLQALLDRPAALERLVRLFAESAWVADLATHHPIVVDELIGQSGATLFDDRATIRREALAESGRLVDADLERQMDALRHFRQARELRVASAALDGELTPMQASDRLSWLAEACVRAALELVAAPLARRYERPFEAPDETGEGGAAAAFGVAVIAYGKLGGLELGFGADLDLVFLRDAEEAEEPASRLVRRFVHFMGTVTPAGRLYEIDLRLRPNGGSGVLVGSLESFVRYQSEDAWTWEHQALLRARAIHGPGPLAGRFAALRRKVLCARRDPESLRVEVASMRARMRETLGGGGGTETMHLKQDAGGIADIEFVVQYLALAHAARHPSLVRHTDNVRVLEQVARHELLDAEEARALADDYVALRERMHRRALALEDALVPLDEALRASRAHVIALRERVLGAEPSGGTAAPGPSGSVDRPPPDLR